MRPRLRLPHRTAPHCTGSFKGGSSLRIADAAVEAAAANVDADLPCLLCVDTFLGDSSMALDRWTGSRNGEHCIGDPANKHAPQACGQIGRQADGRGDGRTNRFAQALSNTHARVHPLFHAQGLRRCSIGLPHVYHQFLTNTKRRREVVLPLALSSLCAVRVLQHLAVERVCPQPDFIYLDASHEAGENVTRSLAYMCSNARPLTLILVLTLIVRTHAPVRTGETLLEIRKAFSLLKPGGVLVGDDLDWPAGGPVCMAPFLFFRVSA